MKLYRKFILTSILFLCVCSFSISLLGKSLPSHKVKSAVETWIRHLTADARKDAVISRMEPYKAYNKTVAYIAHLQDKGFCLCGADDLVLPVYLYNPQGKYDSENPDYNYLLWEIGFRTKIISKGIADDDPRITHYNKTLNNRARNWQTLIDGKIPEIYKKNINRTEPNSMILDLTSQWGQGSPYNDLCPEFNPGTDSRVPVGCMATAMVQIMYYWQWPNSGVSDGSVDYIRRWRDNWDEEPLATDPGIPAGWGGGNRLEWTANNGGRLRMNGRWDISVYNNAFHISADANYRNALLTLYNRLNSATTTCYANFGNTTYDWSIMNDIHSDPPDAGDNEVAKLSYHAGISIDMEYGTWGSMASCSQVPVALTDHFKYENDGVYNILTGVTAMTEEIKWLRPVEMRGCKPDSIGGGCHGWVVYGYDKSTDPNRKFLMNMGWGPATSHVWYTLDNINLQFILNQYHATQMAPEDVVKFVGNTSSGDGSPDNPYKDIEEAVSLSADNTTLIFKAGTSHTFAADTLIISKPLTIKGDNVVIQ